MSPRRRLRVMAAGTGACNNLVRSLKAGAAGVPAVYIRFALHEPLNLRDAYVTVPDHYVVRDLDTLPGVLSANALFAGINPSLADGHGQPQTRQVGNPASITQKRFW